MLDPVICMFLSINDNAANNFHISSDDSHMHNYWDK